MKEKKTIKSPSKILLPKVDVIFKLLFGDKRNNDILTGFLKSVLDLPDDEYENITLEDTQLKRETTDDKLGVVDVRLTTKSGKIVHIEMQILNQDDMPERVTYYNAKMIVTQLKSGNDYDMLVKTISIVISDFEIVKNSPKYHHTFQLNDRETGVNFTDIIEIDTLELNKIPEQSDNTTKYGLVKIFESRKRGGVQYVIREKPNDKKGGSRVKTVKPGRRNTEDI